MSLYKSGCLDSNQRPLGPEQESLSDEAFEEVPPPEELKAYWQKASARWGKLRKSVQKAEQTHGKGKTT